MKGRYILFDEHSNIHIKYNTGTFNLFQYFLRLLLPAGNDLTFGFNWINGNSSSFDVGDPTLNLTNIGSAQPPPV